MKTKRWTIPALIACLFLAHDALAFYNPQTGRWITRDPGGESLNPSVYAIANNDLLDFSEGLGGFITDDPTPTVLGIGVADRDTELGAAWCDLRKPVGSPMDTRNDNKTCGKACTQEHEDVHVKDRQSCCDKARAAFQASGADKKAVDKKYSDWHKATSDFAECRAYKVSGACYERLMKEKNCNKCFQDYDKNGKPKTKEGKELFNCCYDLQHLRSSDSFQESKYCGKTKGKSEAACPF